MRSYQNPETKTIEVSGASLYVSIQQGDATRPPLLLINGVGVNLELFAPFIDALGEVTGPKIGTICFDVPGIGGSPLPPFPLSFRSHARLIARMLDYLGHQRVDVLGVSWGGGLAQQFAYQYPHRCRRLVLAATSTGTISVPGNPQVLGKLLTPGRFRPSDMASVAPELYGGSLRNNPELTRIYAQMAKMPSNVGYYWQVLAGVGWTSVFWLHRLRQPTLIMGGSDDPLVPLANARIMARLIPNATLHIVNGGHLFLLTEAREVAPVVHQFLTIDQG